MKGVEGKCCISSEPRWGVKTTLVRGGPSPQPGTKATLVYFGRELWRRKGEYKVYRRITELKIIPCYRGVANLLLVIIMIVRRTLGPSKDWPHSNVHPTQQSRLSRCRKSNLEVSSQPHHFWEYGGREGARATRERRLEHLGYILGLGVINAWLMWPKLFQGKMF